jgi:hypothetical protein
MITFKQTTLIVSLLLALHTLTYGQTIITYGYDANGNRILRKVVHLRIKQQNDTIVSKDETLALIEEVSENSQDEVDAEEQNKDVAKGEEQMFNETEPSNEESSTTESTTADTRTTEVNNNTATENKNNQQTDASSSSTSAQTGIKALKNQVTVYPNPTRGALSIQGTTNQEMIQLYLRDMKGKLISTTQLAPQGYQQINMRNQPNGNYLLQLINPAGQTETITVIKTE